MEPAADTSFLDRPISDAPLADEPITAAETDPALAFLDEPEVPRAEPEADFSWLDAPLDDAAPVAEADLPHDAPLSAAEAEAEIVAADGGIVPDSPSALDPLPAAPEHEEPAGEEDDDRDAFSWLDAPLPPEPGESARAPIPGRAEAQGEGWALREARADAVLAAEPRKPFFQRLREGLARSSNQLSGQITALFTKRRLDEETLQQFEDVLIQADLGVETAMRITDRLSDGRFGKEITGDAVRQILAEEVERALEPVARPLELDLSVKPHVILVVGVNGTGKTTTIGKLTAKLVRGGLSVTLGAGDTFRAAAVEQLKIWGERTGSPVVAKAIGADAAGLAFEAYDEAVRNGSDVLIIDTAGRLQNRAELMDELAKIVRVLQKREPDAPHTVLQTLDATTGQNALSQVEIFRNVAGVNGLVMTKLDGTARGGILVAIAAKHKLPVFFVGVGEGIDDLEPFKARDFAEAIAGRAGAA
ncbi:signal recognition particle-docking protein FtsY [Aureimonas sp. AU12]|uniref:signal recognition particle-docking protein FtsY n=1 Tax=Aureimonas sp. AU12 TaxID=1638161 RepID=UPI001FCCCF63|nr:signal recognition particle-docking protein FtsY [Aureimonas sp. AU12]